MTFQKTTEKIPEKIIPTLDKLYEEFRTFGTLLNNKIEKLQVTVATQSEQVEGELKAMSNLKECVQSAIDIVSTTSSTFSVETNEKLSVKYGSDFGDIFTRDTNELMSRWISSNTVYEYEDIGSPLSNASDAGPVHATIEYQSDSDSDIENEMIRSLFNEGRKRKDQGDIAGAVRHFRNCLTRFSSNSSFASLPAPQTLSTCGVSIVDLLDILTESYCSLGSWSKAKSTMAEKLSITECQVGKKDERYLWDTMKLAEIMAKNKEYVEAHLQGRKSLRGFKKLGKNGYEGYAKCLNFLVNLCKDEGKADEEDAYADLLSSHEKKLQQRLSKLEVENSPIGTMQPQLETHPRPHYHSKSPEEPAQELNNVHEKALVSKHPKPQDPSSDKEVYVHQAIGQDLKEVDRVSPARTKWNSTANTTTPWPLGTHTVVPCITVSETDYDPQKSSTSTAVEHNNSVSCPTCGISLFGLMENVIAIHINACMYASPIKGITKVQFKTTDLTSEMGWAEFLTYIESMKGTWTCSTCKAETTQLLTDQNCNSCFQKRDFRCPSTLNEFKRQPFDRYHTLLTSLNLGVLDTPDNSALRRKVVLLGDPMCGKTFLASA